MFLLVLKHNRAITQAVGSVGLLTVLGDSWLGSGVENGLWEIQPQTILISVIGQKRTFGCGTSYRGRSVSKHIDLGVGAQEFLTQTDGEIPV